MILPVLVFITAPTTEANVCKGQNVYIVEGGNSAGQAAMYLSNFADQVYILVRKPDLSSSMSQYLIDQISQAPTIQVVGQTEIVEAKREGRLEQLVIRNWESGESKTVPANALFVFIGTRPFTDWLPPRCLKDSKSFIITGRGLTDNTDFAKIWKLPREPDLLETSIPGVLAAGNVRAGAMNRVASAVGEGTMAIKMVHEYLTTV